MIRKCPSESKLASFAVGRLVGIEFERVADHLPGCEACESRISALDKVGDELLNHLQTLPNPIGESGVAGTALNKKFVSSILKSLQESHADDLRSDHGKHFSRLLEQGPCQLGRFELLEVVGAGSFGHVFRAYDSELDREVAIKIQRAGAIASAAEQKQFLHEARSVAQLKHPSIVTLFETGETEDGVCFLVTEFIAGETLESRLEGTRFGYCQSAEFIARLARAVHYAHSQGVVHRDIKPANVMIDDFDRPHLADFGLAKRESPDASLTSDGRVLGTPAYMPPEHARGESHESDARSDIYSVGVMLYEMLTGERPFQGAGRLLLLQVLDEEPRSLRQLDEQIPRDLETICLKAMAKQPSRRYQTAMDFADDLSRFLNGDAIQARPVGYPERLLRWCGKYPFVVALIAAILLGSVAGFVYLRSLNHRIVREMALDNARLYSDMLDEFNEYYSEIRGSFFRHGEDASEVAPPLPATLRIEVAERISSAEGVQVRVFSPYAFRTELRPRDDFEKESLQVFNGCIADASISEQYPLEHYRFLDIEDQPFIKYSRGQLMTESCIECHNTHLDSPKTDWQVGDLAGVFSLTRPMSVDVARAKEKFRGSPLAIVVVSLSLAILGFVVAYRFRYSSSPRLRK